MLLDVVVDGANEKVRAAVAVAADGAGSVLRASAGIDAAVEDYDQIAIVVNAATERPHTGEAFERFTPSGPLAVLPVTGGGYAVVWAVCPARAAELIALDEAGFAAELLDAFGWRAGRWTRIGRRNSYPLALTRAEETVSGRVVLIGNAAQALHPVAGQGFNLGLRDAATLAEMLASAAANSDFAPSAAELLEKFAAWRAEDRKGVTRFTDRLVRLFGSDTAGRWPGAQLRPAVVRHEPGRQARAVARELGFRRPHAAARARPAARMSIDYDVAVVGAGPIGLAAALLHRAPVAALRRRASRCSTAARPSRSMTRTLRPSTCACSRCRAPARRSCARRMPGTTSPRTRA